MTPKFHRGLAEAGPFPGAWAAGPVHLQTPVPLWMPVALRGTGGTGHPFPSTSPGCHLGRGVSAGLRDTGRLQRRWARHSIAPSPGTPRGCCAGCGLLGLCTERAVALPGSPLGCWEEQQPGQPRGSGNVPGAILHCSLRPGWVGTEQRGGQHPTPGCSLLHRPGTPQGPLGGRERGWAAG